MKRYILTLIYIFSCISLMAQDPLGVVFTVNALTEDGKDTTIVVAATNVNSFSFLGGSNSVTNPESGKTMNVDNIDFYAYLDEQTAEKIVVKTIINPNLKFIEMGYCLSKNTHPLYSAGNVSALGKTNTSPVNGIDFDECSCNITDLAAQASNSSDAVFVLYNENKNDNQYFFPSFNGLEYGSTYYVRPFVRFSNNEVMYGSETSFIASQTMQKTCESQEDMAEWWALNEEKQLALNTHALQQVYNAYPGDFGDAEKSKYGISEIMNDYLGSRDWPVLKSNARTIQCIEGTLYVVNDVSKEFIDGFHNFFVTSAQTFSPSTDYVYFDEKNQFTNTTYTEIQDVSCESKWNVPGNHYLMASPLLSTRNTGMTLNIPYYLLADKTYRVEIMFAPVAEEDALDLPSQLRFSWYSSSESGKFPVETNPTFTFMNESSKNFQIPNTGKCETLVLDYTPQYITSLNMLKIESYVLSSQASNYSKVIRVAQIKISPNN